MVWNWPHLRFCTALRALAQVEQPDVPARPLQSSDTSGRHVRRDDRPRGGNRLAPPPLRECEVQDVGWQGARPYGLPSRAYGWPRTRRACFASPSSAPGLADGLGSPTSPAVARLRRFQGTSKAGGLMSGQLAYRRVTKE